MKGRLRAVTPGCMRRMIAITMLSIPSAITRPESFHHREKASTRYITAETKNAMTKYITSPRYATAGLKAKNIPNITKRTPRIIISQPRL